MADKMHVLKIDDDLEQTIASFQSKLKPGEQIISQTVTEGKIIVVTRESYNKTRNLLLEEIDARK